MDLHSALMPKERCCPRPEPPLDGGPTCWAEPSTCACSSIRKQNASNKGC